MIGLGQREGPQLQGAKTHAVRAILRLSHETHRNLLSSIFNLFLLKLQNEKAVSCGKRRQFAASIRMQAGPGHDKTQKGGESVHDSPPFQTDDFGLLLHAGSNFQLMKALPMPPQGLEP